MSELSPALSSAAGFSAVVVAVLAPENSPRTDVPSTLRASRTALSGPRLCGALPLKSGWFCSCSRCTTRLASPRLRRMLYCVL